MANPAPTPSPTPAPADRPEQSQLGPGGLATLPAPPQPSKHGSTAQTRGIHVRVDPAPVADPASVIPDERKTPEFLFSYRVRITNESERRVKLLSRHWVIVDADGDRRDVKGLGVIGQQPTLDPGETHEYTSFCPLPTAWGTMEGVFTMRVEDGSEQGKLFEAAISRFYLVSQ